MSELEPIAAGLLVIRQLTDAEAFRASGVSQREAFDSVLTLAELLPRGSAYLRQCHDRLDELLDALFTAGDSMVDPTPAVVAAAKRCCMPLPVDSICVAPPMLAPTGPISVYDRLDDLVHSLVVDIGVGAAFVVDRDGELVVVAGEVDEMECERLAEEACCVVSGDELRRAGESAVAIDEGQLYVTTLDKRLVLAVMGAGGAWIEPVREAARQAVKERIAVSFPQLRDKDWVELFGP